MVLFGSVHNVIIVARIKMVGEQSQSYYHSLSFNSPYKWFKVSIFNKHQQQGKYSSSPPGGGTWVIFCRVCAADILESLPHDSLFLVYFVANYRPHFSHFWANNFLNLGPENVRPHSSNSIENPCKGDPIIVIRVLKIQPIQRHIPSSPLLGSAPHPRSSPICITDCNYKTSL